MSHPEVFVHGAKGGAGGTAVIGGDGGVELAADLQRAHIVLPYKIQAVFTGFARDLDGEFVVIHAVEVPVMGHQNIFDAVERIQVFFKIIELFGHLFFGFLGGCLLGSWLLRLFEGGDPFGLRLHEGFEAVKIFAGDEV